MDSTRESHAHFPKQLITRLVAFTTLMAGMGIAWIDSRPSWDDTGVTAFAVLLTAFGAAFGGVPWWLAGILASGPLVAFEVWQGVGVLLAVPFALLGALSGAYACRWRTLRD